MDSSPDKGLAAADVRLGRTRRPAAVYWAADPVARRPRRSAHASPAPPFPAGGQPSPAAAAASPIPWKRDKLCLN